MNLFDAHCHLLPPEAFARAAAAGVTGIAVCGTSPGDWAQVFQTLEKFPQVFPSIGIHPWFVGCRAGAETPPETAITDHGYNWRERLSLLSDRFFRRIPKALSTASQIQPLENSKPAGATGFQTLEKILRENPGIGIGETGLDFLERFTNRAEQEASFAAHLDLARELNRPITVHCVQAWGRLIELLREHPAPKIILHAFGGAPELIPELMELNCWFSFCGNVTNPNAKRVRASVVAVPADRLLIETDSPDFPPDGCASPNEPANLIHVARAVAALRGVSVEKIADLTFNNAQQLFIFNHGTH